MKSVRVILAACVLSAFLCLPAGAESAPEHSAASVILMEADSGRVLTEAAANEPRLIASTTKIMTALVVLETCDPEMSVVVDPAWTGIEGSSMYLSPGESLTVKDLLYGLMLASGNDAAVALACISAGSVEAFADRMNEKARALGCENTHFVNPNGLDDEDHYASARDLALIAREALRSDLFRQIVSSRAVSVGGRELSNHNRLLGDCPGVFGVKTGYTRASGRSLVSSCERGGVTLICVTLDDPDDWRDHAALYDWAYDTYYRDDVGLDPALRTIPVIGGAADSVVVSPAEDLSVLRCESDSIQVRVCLPAFVYAAVEAGETAGSMSVFVNGSEYASTPLVFTESVERIGMDTGALSDRIADFLGIWERKIYALS